MYCDCVLFNFKIWGFDLWWVSFGFGCFGISLSIEFVVRFIGWIWIELYFYFIWFISGEIYFRLNYGDELWWCGGNS